MPTACCRQISTLFNAEKSYVSSHRATIAKSQITSFVHRSDETLNSRHCSDSKAFFTCEGSSVVGVPLQMALSGIGSMHKQYIELVPCSRHERSCSNRSDCARKAKHWRELEFFYMFPLHKSANFTKSDLPKLFRTGNDCAEPFSISSSLPAGTKSKSVL